MQKNTRIVIVVFESEIFTKTRHLLNSENPINYVYAHFPHAHDKQRWVVCCFLVLHVRIRMRHLLCPRPAFCKELGTSTVAGWKKEHQSKLALEIYQYRFNVRERVLSWIQPLTTTWDNLWWYQNSAHCFSVLVRAYWITMICGTQLDLRRR